MPKSSVNASLSSYDDIFSTEESRQEEQREQVQQIPIGELFPFKNHPFKVLDDDSMSDMHICAALSESRSSGEIYFAAIAPDMELTVITLDEAPDILPCFDEDDAYLNIPDSSLLLSYNPAQVLKLAGKRYLTGPVILVRTNMDGEFISMTIDEVYLFQKYLASHSITLMADDQKLPCICME